MRNRLRHVLGLLSASLLLSVVLQPSAASAHTRAEAVTYGCGSGYSIVTDGVRNVVTSGGTKWGEVLLTYNAGNGYNCVVTNKTAGSHGTPSEICAFIEVQGAGGTHSCDPDASHWESVKAKAAGKCVAYLGVILAPNSTQQATGGRSEFKNCG